MDGRTPARLVYYKLTMSLRLRLAKYPNPLVTNGLSHPYHLDESTFTFRGIRSILFYFSMNFLCANKKGPDGMPCFAVFCVITSGAILFAHVPQKGHLAYMG